MDDNLKPCPFCGGVATRVDIPADEHDPNAGGSYIACQFCLASSSIAFGDKSNLVDNWNNRANDSRIRAEARAEGLREAADRATTCFIRSMSESGIALGQDYAVLVIADKLRAAILDDKQGRGKN